MVLFVYCISIHTLCDVLLTIVLQLVCSVSALLAASRAVAAELHPHRCRSLRLRRQLLGILRCRARVSLPPVLREYKYTTFQWHAHHLHFAIFFSKLPILLFAMNDVITLVGDPTTNWPVMRWRQLVVEGYSRLVWAGFNHDFKGWVLERWMTLINNKKH